MLNQPRNNLPYDFRVVEIDNIVWLYDDSQRTYLCSFQPSVWLEPLYYVGHEDEDLPDADYWSASDVESRESVAVPVKDEDNWYDDDQEAWNDARDEAHSNCLL